MRSKFVAAGIALLAAAMSLWGADPQPKTDTREFPVLLKDEASPLHNLIQVSPRLYSGSEPHGTESFARLKELGVTTILSVDGALPDVDAAKAFDLRYVHVPIGYDGISKDEAAAMTRVMREVKGPVYVHCHHGKHRGPAAAAVCAIADGVMQPMDGERLLKLAQTSPDYAGLYRDVAAFRPLPADAELPALVEQAKLEPLVESMARIGRLHDELKDQQTTGWKPAEAQPDRQPHQVATLLLEELRESGRNVSNGYGQEFADLMQDCEQAAAALSNSLKDGNTTAANKAFKSAQSSCTACHKEYRD